MEQKFDYAEILLLGPCSCQCFYCLGREMKKASMQSQLTTHFEHWNNFDEFIKRSKLFGIKKVYISSVNTDPLLYKYLYDLILCLKQHFMYVGIRGNAANLSAETNRALDLCNEEISISLNSITYAISENIAGSKARYEFANLKFWLERDERLKLKKNIRISIVVNRYNAPEILMMLRELSYYDEQIAYVQLRKVYKFSENEKEDFQQDAEAFELIKQYIETSFEKVGSFKETPIYQFVNPFAKYSGDGVHDDCSLNVSLWEDVFDPTQIRSMNYFSDGKISENHLLVPGHENEN